MPKKEHASHDTKSKQRIQEDVEQYGFHIAKIPSDDYSPTFYYSIGFHQTYGKPEIAVFALPPNTVQHIFAIFLFNEPRNLATFTEPAILDGEPILEVYHDFDGDWQFVTGRELGENDEPKVVSLDRMVKLDPSLNEIHYLNYGEVAKRLSKNDKWVITEMEKSQDNE